MKTSAIKILASTAAFFALCVPSIACDEDCTVTYSANSDQADASDDLPEVTTPVAPVNPLTPAKVAELKARAAELKALAASRAASQKAAVAAVAALQQKQSHVSVVSSTPASSTSTSSTSNSSEVPTARVRVVPAGSTNSQQVTKSRVTVVSTKDPKAAAPVVPQTYDSPPYSKDDTSKVSDAVKGLAGDWLSVTRKDDGGLSTVELQMDDQGVAKLTMPDGGDKRSSSTHKVELQDNKLTLTGGDHNIAFGKVVSVDRRQMVLELATGPMTFVRATAVN